MADISLQLGPPKSGAFQVTDNKTGQPISGAVLTNQATDTNSNPEVATFEIDASGTPVGTPIASGAGTVIFRAHVAGINDPGDGTPIDADFQVAKNFAVITGPDGVSLDVVF